MKNETLALLHFEFCSALVEVLDLMLTMAGNSLQLVTCKCTFVDIRETWCPGKEHTVTIPKLPWGPRVGGWREPGISAAMPFLGNHFTGEETL